MLLINHMVLQLRAGREQKAWQPFGDWHLVSESPSFFCSSLSAHFHPSIPSLFNWLSVKVLLSASTCPCHSKQRQPGDTALSVLSPVSALSSPLPPFLTFFHFVSSWFSPLSLWHFSLSLYHSLSLSCSGLYFFFISLFILSHPFSYSLHCFCLNVLALWQTYIITAFVVYLPFSFFFFLLYSQSLGQLNMSVTPFLSSYVGKMTKITISVNAKWV